MPTILSKLSRRQAVIAAGVGVAALLFVLYKKQSAKVSNLKTVPSVQQFLKQEEKRKKNEEKTKKIHVNAEFFRNLFKILRILVPSPFCAEVGYLLLVAVALLGRTYADVWMISNTTAIESAIIDRESPLYMKNLLQYICAMPAISVVNNLLKYGLSHLKLRFRERLTSYLYDQYLNEFTFYKMANLDNRIANADQLLTQDVEKFCGGLTELYSNLTKPVLDVFLYIVRLTTAIGAHAPFNMLLYLFISGIFLTWLRRPIGKMTVVEQQLEGEFRFINSRLITNSEEIAFYKGNIREQNTVERSFDKLVRHLKKLELFRFTVGFFDNIVAKYCATVVGWYSVSRTFLDLTNPHWSGKDRSRIMQEYYKGGRMMFKLAEAIGRLSLAGREMTRLAGFTARVTELMTVLNDLNAGKYKRTMLNGAGENFKEKFQIDVAAEESPEELVDDENETFVKTGYDSNDSPYSAPRRRLDPGSGRLKIMDNIIRFEHVPLVTPNGDVLIQEMNFEVRSGMNVLVCGPNGCGKSSLFRILGELWPLFGGCLTKPDKGKLFYIPQRPYMTLGTLRDQIIYPDSKKDMEEKGKSDNDLLGFMDLVQLRYILSREGGWDVVQDWMDVLSGGEKQRVAMARLFYHQPQFAILDECTSAVSVDVEGSMYQYCRRTGITLFTVSHRKSLWKHHEYYLHMDGRGSYEFERIDESTQEFGS